MNSSTAFAAAMLVFGQFCLIVFMTMRQLDAVVITTSNSAAAIQPQEKQSLRSTTATTTTTTATIPSTNNIMNTYPLIMGNSSLIPIDLLEDEFQLNQQHCLSYQAPKGDEFICHIEWDEWMTTKAFVQEGDVVMEFGGRFGTTACILSRAVGQTGAVVTVEPDRNVQGHLLSNRFRHHCGFHVLLGTVSKQPLYVKENGRDGYGTQTTTKQQKGKGTVALANMELAEVERLIGRKINVALIDCEGCIPSVDETGLLDQVELILMEEDALRSYKKWHTTLFQKGFDCIWYLKDTANPSIPAWAKVRHSVWLKKGSTTNRPKYPTCEEYAQQTGLSKTPKLFMCAACPVPEI